MQFGFKTNHSTVVCTAIYYTMSTKAVIVIVDTSKAFDRVHWGKTFPDYNRAKSAFLFIQLLLVSCLRQLSCVAW